MKSRPGAAIESEFEVVAGLHKGASAALPEGATTLGRAPTCDVILRDAGIEPHHITVWISGARISVKALGARVVVDGEAVPVGKVVDIRSGELRVADATLRVCSARRRGGSTSPQQRRRFLVVAWPMLGVLAAISAAMTLTEQSGTDPRVAAAPAGQGVGLLPSERVEVGASYKAAVALGRQLAADGAFNGVRLMQSANGRIELNGTVRDEATLTRLKGLPAVRASGADVGHVVALDTASRHASNYLRDPSVQVEARGSARLVAVGTPSRPTTAVRLAQLQKEFGPIVEIGSEIAQNTSESSLKVQIQLPFQITGINVGRRQFETSDGGRFGEGATLPNGFKVVEVSGRSIVFDVSNRLIEYPL
jgi:hypothetical protein